VTCLSARIARAVDRRKGDASAGAYPSRLRTLHGYPTAGSRRRRRPWAVRGNGATDRSPSRRRLAHAGTPIRLQGSRAYRTCSASNAWRFSLIHRDTLHSRPPDPCISPPLHAPLGDGTTQSRQMSPGQALCTRPRPERSPPLQGGPRHGPKNLLVKVIPQKSLRIKLLLECQKLLHGRGVHAPHLLGGGMHIFDQIDTPS